LQKRSPIQSEIDRLEDELSFKQLQINRLLTVTQAINSNASAANLFETYNSILGFDMRIPKMLLMTRHNDAWQYATGIHVSRNFATQADAEHTERYKRMCVIDEAEDPFLCEFDFVIPIFHKTEPIATAFLGGLRSDPDLYEKAQFIQTITNIITIAIENKRLFKRQIEQERMKKEMELAASVQTMLIPAKLPKTAAYEFDGIYMPHSGVGGDYYDCIKLNDHEIVFCIADISGKGIPAAILMANFQANVQTLVRKHITPDKFVELLNKAVQRITKGDKFITFFVAKYHTLERKMQYINAGHNPPVLLANGELTQLTEGCTILGAFDEIKQIQVGEIHVPPNSLVVCYTDGLTDLQDEQEEFFGEERFYAFAKSHALLSPHEFNKQLIARINEFRHTQNYNDDITILTAKML
jgi:phosphoserine phosphatase RsbU/P